MRFSDKRNITVHYNYTSVRIKQVSIEWGSTVVLLGK